ncbi:delta-like protein A [Haliotis rufescens]|uniref:delta-like protein A n=1 Tax=Haliotis rufescens TaxID=6454 RepID=UPI00201F564F|nr:delta-like protein A [Haliotis rufescens]
MRTLSPLTLFISSCDINPCENGGACSVENSAIVCKCTSGHGGDRCELASCDINPCENGGACSVENSAIVCKCTSGHGGDRCELASGAATISGHFLLLTVVAVLAKLNLN